MIDILMQVKCPPQRRVRLHLEGEVKDISQATFASIGTASMYISVDLSYGW